MITNEMFHPVGEPSPFSYPRVHDSVATLPTCQCHYGLVVAGVRIGETDVHCGARVNVADNVEKFASWSDYSDSLYSYLNLCPAHQVQDNDLRIALSGLIDLVDHGMMPSRMQGLGPLVLPPGMDLQDAAPLMANLMAQNLIASPAPTAEEVMAHMTVEGAQPWLGTALSRLARLGYLVEVSPGRFSPTDFGRMCINISRSELRAAGLLA